MIANLNASEILIFLKNPIFLVLEVSAIFKGSEDYLVNSISY